MIAQAYQPYPDGMIVSEQDKGQVWPPVDRTPYTLDGVDFDWLGYVLASEQGPICGACSNHHASVKAIRVCHGIMQAQEDEMRAEQAAEQGYERYLEDRGYWDARAQEDHERAMGVYA